MGAEKIRAVIFDWAGTLVDYGCFAPLKVFLEVFGEKGIVLTLEEVRAPMGLPKLDHIRALFAMPRLASLWKQRFGKAPEETDVLALYNAFESTLLRILPEYSEPVPGAVETLRELRKKDIKIGSTTGYNKKMMSVVLPEAARKGCAPDCCVTSDHLPGGRPAPWMCFENAKALTIYPMRCIMKVGDTISDIREGLNAGCWSIGVMDGSSELGLSVAQRSTMPASELARYHEAVQRRFSEAGAHAVLRTISELPELVEAINERLLAGDRP